MKFSESVVTSRGSLGVASPISPRVCLLTSVRILILLVCTYLLILLVCTYLLISLGALALVLILCALLILANSYVSLCSSVHADWKMYRIHCKIISGGRYSTVSWIYLEYKSASCWELHLHCHTYD